MFMKGDFDKAGARILIMSCGSCDAAVKWRQDTTCQYPILLDPERKVRHVICASPFVVNLLYAVPLPVNVV